jgi:hypothetical protein
MSGLFRAGLIVLGVMSLADLASPLLTDGQHPPMSIALIGSAAGLISLILVALAWRGRTAAAIALVVVRILSALTAVPAFSTPDVPAAAVVLAGIFLTVTLLGVVLTLAGVRRPALVAAS